MYIEPKLLTLRRGNEHEGQTGEVVRRARRAVVV